MEKYLEEFLRNLTPSELDELAPEGFIAVAPRGTLKRIEKCAIEKAGVRPAKRKRYFKPLMIAAAAVVASVITVLTVNASTGGNIVKFFIGGEEIEGSHRDYVDHDGYRHVTFETVVPLEFTNYALIVDVDNPEEFVRVFTDESDPEFMSKVRQYNDAVKLDSDCTPEDFGIVLTDSQELMWEFFRTEVNSNGVEMCYGNGGSYSGKFKYQKTPHGKDYTASTGIKDRDYENNTKTITISYVFYVGEDYAKESVKEVEGNYRDYVDHDGYRNVSFKATIPFSAEYYVVIFDVDAATTDEAVRVITSYSDPDFIDKLRQYRAAEKERSEKSKELWDRIYAWKGRNMQDDDVDERDRVRQEALEAGVFTPDELGKYPEPEDFGIVLKDSELLCYDVNYYYDGTINGGGGGSLGGEFMFMGEAEGHPWGGGLRNKEYDDDDWNIDYENETVTRTYSFFYYVGKD